MWQSLVLLSLAAALIWQPSTIHCQDIRVSLRQGVLRGSSNLVNGRQIFYFLGVPYAEPPVNDRRFRPTIPHKGWNGIYEARLFRPVCPQPTGSPIIRDTMAEDCLYLNVWTPILPLAPGATGIAKRPVVVFIEGQLFTLSNPADVPGEDFVAETGAVMVTLAYRVNALGFLSFEDPAMPGNMGLADQQLAMSWVYENIDNFGGDRNRITLMGHSAGAASVFYHLLNQRSQPYIQSAIMMSGSVLSPWAFQPEPLYNARVLATSLGCFSYYVKELLTCMQSKRMLDIMVEVNRLILSGNISALYSPAADWYYVPTDQVFVRDNPHNSLKRGEFKKVPQLTGVMTDEGVLMGYFLKQNLNRLSVRDIKYFISQTVIPSLIRQIPTLPRIDLIRDIISFSYFGVTYKLIAPQDTNFDIVDERDRPIVYDEIVGFFTDAYFLGPLDEQNRLVARFNERQPIFFYANDFRSLDIFGNTFLNRTAASHGSDLLYIYGPEMYRRFFGRNFETPNQENQGRILKNVLGQFIYGTFPGNLRWAPFTLEERSYFDVITGLPNRRYRNERAYNFWYSYLPDVVYQVDFVNGTYYSESNLALVAKIKIRSGTTFKTSSTTCQAKLTCSVYLAFTYIFLVIILCLVIGLCILYSLLGKKGSKKPEMAADKKPVIQPRDYQPMREEDLRPVVVPLPVPAVPPNFQGLAGTRIPPPTLSDSSSSDQQQPRRPGAADKAPLPFNVASSRINEVVPQEEFVRRGDLGRLSSRRWRQAITDYRL